jgi:hypothetical protein
VDGKRAGGEKGGRGMGKMFYFSFDNKEEMFIRLKGEGKRTEAEIHYTINIY